MSGRRLAVVRVATPDDAHKQGLDWLSTADDAIVACRAQGHSWPKLRAGKQNRRIGARMLGDGSVALEFTCTDCTTVRTIVTRPGGVYDYDARYTYSYPDGYASPKDSNLNRRDAFAEVYRRTREELLAGLKPADIPPVKFKAGA